MKLIYKAHIDSRKKPVNLKEEDLKLFSHELEKKIQETHVLNLENAFILQDSIFTFKGLKFYTEYTHVTGLKNSLKLNRALMLRKEKQTIDHAIWVVDDWSAGYFHWLTDALPRLMAVGESNYPILIPAHFEKMRYVVESCAYLDIRHIYYDTFKPYKVKDLILPSHTANTGNYNKELINQLRDRFLAPQKKNTPSRKIYISRKKAPKRYVKNEDELQKIMLKHNYEIHYFEDYDFKSQIQIMSETLVVVGLHGAGLTNILFMQKGGQMMELRNEDDSHNNCYFSLASDLGIDYFYQLNKGNGDTHLVEITVDLNELDKNLQLMQSKLKAGTNVAL